MHARDDPSGDAMILDPMKSDFRAGTAQLRCRAFERARLAGKNRPRSMTGISATRAPDLASRDTSPIGGSAMPASLVIPHSPQ